MSKFRVTSNGLWFRVEYNWGSDDNPEWNATKSAECYGNIPGVIPTIEEADRICRYLSDGGAPQVFKPVVTS